ncbi:MAG: hypothetical protein RRB22_14330 [Gammaproteobacteria bacterium]|nr:hypothetical protein [Gammaproteobacteria bacterium]
MEHATVSHRHPDTGDRHTGPPLLVRATTLMRLLTVNSMISLIHANAKNTSIGFFAAKCQFLKAGKSALLIS